MYLVKGSLTVYLIHGILIKRLGILGFKNKNMFIVVLHMVLSVISIHSVCWIVYLIYSKYEKVAFWYYQKNS